MKFIKLAQTLQALQQEPSRTTMTKLLAELFEQSSAAEIQIISYLSLGSLFAPYQDKQFNIATKGMLDIIAGLVQLPVADVQQRFGQLGDLGLVVQELWLGADAGLSVEEVYSELLHVTHVTGTGSVEKKSELIQALLRRVDGVGAKFIVRIVTKTLRLGFSDMTILDALSWMHVGNKSLSKQLEAAYNVCADLGLVAATLKQEGMDAVRSMNIRVGIPIRPAAAERLTSPAAVVERLGECVAQPKLDGFRIQVHVEKVGRVTHVHFFSRNMLDMSNMFPELKKVVESLPVQSLICEGEAIAYDEDTDTFLPFQMTVKRKRKHDVEQASQDLPLRLYLFDILYLNGQSLLDQPHAARRETLLNLVNACNDPALRIVDELLIQNSAQLENYFLLNIQSGLEGLVVKRPDATCQPGKRNFNWIKLKREAHGSLIDTVDVVILGYYAGRGKRAHFGMGAFLVGVYNDQKDVFQTVAKVGTGLKDAEWKELKQQCDLIGSKTQPKQVVCAKELYPDAWVQPELVCTIQSDEITLSPLHTAGKTEGHLGFALRFPRFVCYRPDKSARDATTVAELKRLYELQKVKA